MKAGVQVISRETIKPSSQILNHHPKKLKFSYIDQLLPQVYTPLIFFYQADESKGLTSSNHVQISHKLKQSLSDCLPSFYPLAGRIKDNNSVDCNAAGVDFIVARTQAQLNDIVQEPDMDEIKQYLPLDPATTLGHVLSTPLLLVQLTFFDCGGMAVGACVSHKVIDLTSTVEFFKAWSAKCCGEEPQVSHFSFGTSKYFPPNFVISNARLWKFLLPKEKQMTKRFVFDAEIIALLRQVATDSNGIIPTENRTIVDNPTRVELVSAFIWKCAIEMARIKRSKKKKTFIALHAVNLRTRTNPPQLLHNVLGNCVMSSFAEVAAHDYASAQDIRFLVWKLRSSIRRVRNEYSTKPLNRESAMKDLLKVGLQFILRKLELCFFTSWCRFPVYEIDYGWGRPIWFTTTARPLKNHIVLINSRGGDAIEAIVTSTQDILAKLETQIKLISP